MAIDWGEKYAPDWDGRPSHMSARDRPLWWAWWPTARRNAVAMWFDVAVGPLPYIPPKTPDDLARMWARLNRKRIDAVIQFPDWYEIVELRWDASASALGRLAMYRDLWLKEAGAPGPVHLRLVTNRVDEAWRATAAAMGITVTVPEGVRLF
jgi:hypothetical protein